MDQGTVQSSRVVATLWLLAVLIIPLVAGCGYMPRTANQIDACIHEQCIALRQEMSTSKEEMMVLVQGTDQRLAAIDTRLAEMEATLQEMKDLESTMQAFRTDMTAVRDDLRRVREDLRSSVRKELGEAMMDAGSSLQSGAGP
jgi:hypothetical protein